MGTHAHRHLVTINDAPDASQDLLIPPDAGGSLKAAAPLTLEHQCRTWIAPHRNGLCSAVLCAAPLTKRICAK